MNDVTINLGPIINRKEVNKVKSILDKTKEGDRVVISMEAADAHQADAISELLKLNGFDYQPKGSHDGNRYHIIATKLI